MVGMGELGLSQVLHLSLECFRVNDIEFDIIVYINTLAAYYVSMVLALGWK